MKNKIRLVDEYRYRGFRPLSKIQEYPGIPDARIITLRRRQKKQYVDVVARSIILFMIESLISSATCHAGMREYTLR